MVHSFNNLFWGFYKLDTVLSAEDRVVSKVNKHYLSISPTMEERDNHQINIE